MLCPECLTLREGQRRTAAKIAAPLPYLKSGVTTALILCGIFLTFFIGMDSIETYFLDRTFSSERPAAPYFKAKLHGEDTWVSLSELEGKVVVLDFWASWCKPCIELMPVFRELQRKYEGKDVAILGINQDEKKSDFLAAMEKYEINWPQIIDFDNSEPLSVTYKVTQIPTTIIIDKKGRIYKHWGKWDRKLSHFIDYLLEQPF
jgi:thiol-disulfide isomerase/thioredoxin